VSATDLKLQVFIESVLFQRFMKDDAEVQARKHSHRVYRGRAMILETPQPQRSLTTVASWYVFVALRGPSPRTYCTQPQNRRMAPCRVDQRSHTVDSTSWVRCT
jgi:hypothetical protein